MSTTAPKIIPPTDPGSALVAIALGANLPGALGGPADALRFAVQQLEIRLDRVRVAPVYRTAAVSPIPQPDYLNTALTGRTSLDPFELLGLLKALERAAGRRAGPRLGPRALDLDLLTYGGRKMRSPGLTLPHPGLAHRRFVLEPLARIAPGLEVTPGGETAAGLLAALGDEPSVEEIGPLESVAVTPRMP